MDLDTYRSDVAQGLTSTWLRRWWERLPDEAVRHWQENYEDPSETISLVEEGVCN